MRRITLLLLTIPVVHGFGQTYYPFPTDSAKWSVMDYMDWPDWQIPPVPDECITRHYGFANDTVINGKTYGKLYGNNLYADYPYSDLDFNLATATYVAAVREDSSKKVWVRNATDSIDFLYYDFALDTGDTFCFDYFAAGCYQVIYIDSILIDGNYRRQIHFNTSGAETWIEGIGSTVGWFEFQWIGSISYYLDCFFENETQLFATSGNCHCDTYTGIEQINNDVIKVFPNPVTTEINIEFKNSFKQINIELYTLLGNKIWAISSIDKSIKIDVSKLPVGPYFILFTDDQNNQWLKKIIKTSQ